MPLDPNIIMGFQPTPNIGPNLGQSVANANGLLQLQQAQQAQKTQNALRDILGRPGAIDATGNPTPEALQQVTAVSPDIGIKLRQNMLKQQEDALRLGVLKTDAFAKKTNMVMDSYAPVMEAFDEARKAGKPEEQALKIAQEALTAKNDELGKAGFLSESEVKALPTQFDPVKMRAVLANGKAYSDWRDRQAQEQREQRTERREDRRDSETERYHRAVEGDRELSNPVMLQWTDDKGQTHKGMGQQDKRTGQWFTADEQRLPISSPEPYKEPQPGTAAAAREAIFQDLSDDPAWKDKPRGARMVEADRQFKMAGQLASPEARHAVAEAIASYSGAPFTAWAMSKPGAEETMAEVYKINPDYSAPVYNSVNKTVSAFSSGRESQNVRFLNNATQHLDTLAEAAKAMKNDPVNWWNSIANTIAKAAGEPAPNTYEGLAQIVGTEVEKAVAGNTGAVVDRERLARALASARSPEQIADVIKGFKSLMAGQARSLKAQYEAGTPDQPIFRTGAYSFDKKLLPETREQLGLLERPKGEKPPGNSGGPPAKGAGAPEIPQEAIDILRARPDTAAKFEKRFGLKPGDAQNYLKDSGKPPPADAAKPGEAPPGMPPNARRAPDGNYYVPKADGKGWQLVVPAGQQ